jgi:hypothetical protein
MKEALRRKLTPDNVLAFLAWLVLMGIVIYWKSWS